MSLHFVSPGPDVLDTYNTSVLDFMGPQDPPLELYHLPVGVVGLPALAQGGSPSSIAASGCRFIAAWPNGRVTSSEMTNPTLYGQALFRNFVEGDLPSHTLALIHQAQTLAATQSADFELHYLNVAGIQFEALHLVNEGALGDLIFPVLSAYPELDTGVMDAAAFFSLAQAVATVRLAHPASALSS